MRRQKKSPALCFDRYDKMRLQKALKQISDKRIFIRVKAVLLMAQGMSADAVAAIMGTARRSIYNWLHAYLKHHQISSLFDAPRSGRPFAAQQITDKRILMELRRNPLHLGYNTTVWTVSLLAAHLSNRYGQEIRYWTLYRRMKQMGLRCKRPRYVYSEKDPHRAQKKGGYRAKAKPHATFSGTALPR